MYVGGGSRGLGGSGECPSPGRRVNVNMECQHTTPFETHLEYRNDFGLTECNPPK